MTPDAVLQSIDRLVNSQAVMLATNQIMMIVGFAALFLPLQPSGWRQNQNAWSMLLQVATDTDSQHSSRRICSSIYFFLRMVLNSQ